MADEKKAPQDETEGAPKPKKSAMKMMLVLGVAALVLGGGGFTAYTILLAKPPESAKTEPKAPPQQENLDKIVGTMVPLDTFLVNIDDDGQTRFLKTTLTLELNDEKLSKEVDMRIAQIRDNILLLLSSKRFSEVRSIDGKYILREEILDQLNGVLITGKLKNVYFTEFVVQ